MKKFLIVLCKNVSLTRINSQTVFALSVEEARNLAKEIFRPNRWQFVGAEAIQNKSITKHKK